MMKPAKEGVVSVQLTVREAMALGLGVKYPGRGVEAEARRKVRSSLESVLFTPAADKLRYELIEA